MNHEKLVTADHRKGLVQLKQSSEDGLIHFVWKDRGSNKIEHDLIIFPEDAVFRKVGEANARVYVLEFKSSSKLLFFWLQEQSAEKDEKNCADINKFINNPPQPGSNTGGNGKLDNLAGLDQNQLLQFLANASQSGNLSGLRDLLRGVQRPSETTSTSTQSQPQSQPQTQTQTQPRSQPQTQTQSQPQANFSAQIHNIVSKLSQDKKPQAPETSLSDILNIEEVIKSGLLDNDKVLEKLAEYLPEGESVNMENLRENLNSNQFKEAIRTFNAALQGGELKNIASSFGLDASTLGANAKVEDFLIAVQNKVNKENEKEDKGKEKKEEEKDTTNNK